MGRINNLKKTKEDSEAAGCRQANVCGVAHSIAFIIKDVFKLLKTFAIFFGEFEKFCVFLLSLKERS